MICWSPLGWEACEELVCVYVCMREDVWIQGRERHIAHRRKLEEQELRVESMMRCLVGAFGWGSL